MKASLRIFAGGKSIGGSSFSGEKVKEQLNTNEIVFFFEGRERTVKGFIIKPETPEELNEFIEALKQYKLLYMHGR